MQVDDENGQGFVEEGFDVVPELVLVKPVFGHVLAVPDAPQPVYVQAHAQEEAKLEEELYDD